MKNVGFFLLMAGFLTAAYSTALDIESTRWAMFIPAAIAGIVGVFMIKIQSRGEAKSEHVLSTNRNELNESLGNIVGSLERISEAGDSIATADLREDRC